MAVFHNIYCYNYCFQILFIKQDVHVQGYDLIILSSDYINLSYHNIFFIIFHSEFKEALQSLKSSHPEAYAQISKSLPKSDSKKASPPDHVMTKQAAIAMTTPQNQWVLAMEEAIVPQESRSVDAEYQGASLSTTVHVADQQQAIRDLISVLPAEDVHIRDCKIITMATEESDSDSSLDEEPIAGVSSCLLTM